MRQEDVIRMAREAGAYSPWKEDDWAFDLRDLERFFHMAQAAEREECIEACQALVIYGPIAEEQWYNQAYWRCVDAIRARGEK